MINTAAFESLQRYKLLDEAYMYIKSQHGLSPFAWMEADIFNAMERERRFMEDFGGMK